MEHSKIVKASMPNSQRAKLFQPFDALKGLKEAIAAKEYSPTVKKQLSEERVHEINEVLITLEPGEIITVIYYGSREQEYIQLTGPVKKVDSYWKVLQIGNTAVDFFELFDIQRISPNNR